MAGRLVESTAPLAQRSAGCESISLASVTNIY